MASPDMMGKEFEEEQIIKEELEGIKKGNNQLDIEE